MTLQAFTYGNNIRRSVISYNVWNSVSFARALNFQSILTDYGSVLFHAKQPCFETSAVPPISPSSEACQLWLSSVTEMKRQQLISLPSIFFTPLCNHPLTLTSPMTDNSQHFLPPLDCLCPFLTPPLRIRVPLPSRSSCQCRVEETSQP